MLCSDTGGHEAIHLPREVVELAADLHKLLTTLKDVGTARQKSVCAFSLEVTSLRFDAFLRSHANARKARDSRHVSVDSILQGEQALHSRCAGVERLFCWLILKESVCVCHESETASSHRQPYSPPHR